MFKEKVVLITGGSDGFGLAIAEAFGKAEAHVILLARNLEKLNRAAEKLRQSEVSVSTICGDVLQADSVSAAAELVERDFGGIDVLVNNVGYSDRGRVAEQSAERFLSSLELNFLSTVRCTQAFLPQLIRKEGSIVNVGSLASKVVSPFLGTYSASKFAVDAYSRQLRIELRENGVNVLLVCPGPFRRDDAGKRYEHLGENLPESALKPGGGARVKELDAGVVARLVVKACSQKKSEIVVPTKTRILMAVYAISPEWGDWLFRKLVSPKPE